MKKKDILFLCQYFYPEYISSATLPYDTALALKKENFSIGVLCGFPKEYSKNQSVGLNEVHEGIAIKRLRYIQLNRVNLLGRIINYFSFTFAVFLRLLHFRNFKVVIVYSNPPILPLVATFANIIFNIKIIFVSYDVYPEIAIRLNAIKDNGFMYRVMMMTNDLIFKRSKKVIALSIDMKNFFLKNRKNVQEENIIVIPNWYEEVELSNKSSSNISEYFLKLRKNNKFIISYFGNMGIAQEFETLLGAIEHFKNDEHVHFVFAGHGSKLSMLKDTISNSFTSNVDFHDFLIGEDYHQALTSTDVFVVSLNNNLMGLASPSKFYPYLMAGKPIITIMNKEIDIAREIEKYDAGYCLNVGDVDKLIDVINHLKNNRGEGMQKGSNARLLFLEKYTKQIATDKYVNMIKDVLEANHV